MPASGVSVPSRRFCLFIKAPDRCHWVSANLSVVRNFEGVEIGGVCRRSCHLTTSRRYQIRYEESNLKLECQVDLTWTKYYSEWMFSMPQLETLPHGYSKHGQIPRSARKCPPEAVCPSSPWTASSSFHWIRQCLSYSSSLTSFSTTRTLTVKSQLVLSFSKSNVLHTYEAGRRCQLQLWRQWHKSNETFRFQIGYSGSDFNAIIFSTLVCSPGSDRTRNEKVIRLALVMTYVTCICIWQYLSVFVI
jgi:hypothetical protein